MQGKTVIEHLCPEIGGELALGNELGGCRSRDQTGNVATACALVDLALVFPENIAEFNVHFPGALKDRHLHARFPALGAEQVLVLAFMNGRDGGKSVRDLAATAFMAGLSSFETDLFFTGLLRGLLYSLGMGGRTDA